MQRILPIALITLLCAYQSFAASFDCAKTTTRTEKMICSNLEISRAAEQLATAYKLQGAEVDVQSKGLECGMRGYFGGSYHKSMKGRK